MGPGSSLSHPAGSQPSSEQWGQGEGRQSLGGASAGRWVLGSFPVEELGEGQGNRSRMGGGGRASPGDASPGYHLESCLCLLKFLPSVSIQ